MSSGQIGVFLLILRFTSSLVVNCYLVAATTGLFTIEFNAFFADAKTKFPVLSR